MELSDLQKFKPRFDYAKYLEYCKNNDEPAMFYSEWCIAMSTISQAEMQYNGMDIKHSYAQILLKSRFLPSDHGITKFVSYPVADVNGNDSSCCGGGKVL